jgi:hypothetical protein
MSSLEKSKQAVTLLKEAILETIAHHPDGIGNSDIARALKLESDFEGSQKNYLSWSVIGLLVNEGKVKYKKVGSRKFYYINR